LQKNNDNVANKEKGRRYSNNNSTLFGKILRSKGKGGMDESERTAQGIRQNKPQKDMLLTSKAMSKLLKFIT